MRGSKGGKDSNVPTYPTNVDPLKCTYCNGKMRIISFIEDEENIKKILKHLNLWEVQNHDPPENYKIPDEYKQGSSFCGSFNSHKMLETVIQRPADIKHFEKVFVMSARESDKYLIEKNIVSFGNKLDTNIDKSKTYAKNNSEIYNDDFDSFPDYDTCDPMPNYDEWS
jgi:hypothetical protein